MKFRQGSDSRPVVSRPTYEGWSWLSSPCGLAAHIPHSPFRGLLSRSSVKHFTPRRKFFTAPPPTEQSAVERAASMRNAVSGFGPVIPEARPAIDVVLTSSGAAGRDMRSQRRISVRENPALIDAVSRRYVALLPVNRQRRGWRQGT